MCPFNGFLVVLLTFFVTSQADDSTSPGPHSPMHLLRGDLKPDFQKCLDESGLTRDEIKAAYENPPKELTEKQLCLAKCLATASGLLKDGVVATDIVKKNAPSDIDEAQLSTTIKCIEAAGKISTCNDMAKVIKCLPKRLE